MGTVSLAEVKKRVVRFKELRPLEHAYEETQLPAHQRVLLRYIGNQASEAADVPPAVEGLTMNVSLATAAPGKGAPLHDHECEETFFVVQGAFVIYFGDAPQEEVLLQEWDAISVPPGIHRGWRATEQRGYLMAILGAGKTDLPTYRADYGALPRVVQR